MSVLLFVASALLAFVALSGFLLGQLFTGYLMPGAMLAGVGGIISAGGALRMALQPRWTAPWVTWAGALTLAGVAIDAVMYYRTAAIAGNYYGWGLVAPFAVSAAFTAAQAHRRTRHDPDDPAHPVG